jgi:hypothetical protein
MAWCEGVLFAIEGSCIRVVRRLVDNSFVQEVFPYSRDERMQRLEISERARLVCVRRDLVAVRVEADTLAVHNMHGEAIEFKLEPPDGNLREVEIGVEGDLLWVLIASISRADSQAQSLLKFVLKVC